MSSVRAVCIKSGVRFDFSERIVLSASSGDSVSLYTTVGGNGVVLLKDNFNKFFRKAVFQFQSRLTTEFDTSC